MKPGADAFIDTNILVYAIDSESRYYQAARSVLERERLTYAVSPQIIFEFLSVVTNPKRVRHPLDPKQAWEVIQTILDHRNIRVLSIDADVVQKAMHLAVKHQLKGPRVFDAVAAGVIIQNHIPLVITVNVKDFEAFGITATHP